LFRRWIRLCGNSDETSDAADLQPRRHAATGVRTQR
jgi:hypothetical protein